MFFFGTEQVLCLHHGCVCCVLPMLCIPTKLQVLSLVCAGGSVPTHTGGFVEVGGRGAAPLVTGGRIFTQLNRRKRTVRSGNHRDSPASCRSSAQTCHCLLSDLSPISIKSSPALCLCAGFPLLPCSAQRCPVGSDLHRGSACPWQGRASPLQREPLV